MASSSLSTSTVNLVPSLSTPIFSLSLKIQSLSLLSKPQSYQHLSVKSSQSPFITPLFSIKTILPFAHSLLKITITIAALLLVRQKPLSALALPIPQTTLQSTDVVLDEQNLDDVQSLRSLMESEIKNKRPDQAIPILDRLIELEPEDLEWRLLKCHMHTYIGEAEFAKIGFEDVISRDPLHVEAYHGLVMIVSQSKFDEKEDELTELFTRIEVAIENCEKESRIEDVRDLKLLIAQIKVVRGHYHDALAVYEKLANEEPNDFRPYMCQGILYTLMKRKDEADKYFDKYRTLVPKDHPYAQYFDENMLSKNVFQQKG